MPGGCAVTHAAILSGKYKKIIFNDITDSTQVFLDAIRGKFRNENRWISREDFKRLKDTDAYVRICFSFGNDQRGYAYGDIEPYKRAFHYAVVFQDLQPFKDLGVFIPKSVVKSDNIISRRMSVKKYLIWLKNNKHAGDLQSLERLQRLQSLELNNYQGDYRKVPIPTNESCVIYCDPPYRGTAEYLNKFNFNEFDDWCREHKDNVFISEYNMPKDFRMISAIGKRSLLAANGSRKIKTEGFWVHKDVYDKYKNHG